MALTPKKVSELPAIPGGVLTTTFSFEISMGAPLTSYQVTGPQLVDYVWTRPVKNYTVAALPAGTAGQVAWATNGRAFNGAGVQEGAGAGTGVLVTHNGTAWKIAGTNVTVTA